MTSRSNRTPSAAQAHYFRKEFEAFRSAAERALALNPLDGATVEYLAHLLAFAGDWERGSELDKRARLLNPHHPAWYWAVPLLDAYRKGDYQGARASTCGRCWRSGQASPRSPAISSASGTFPSSSSI